MTVQLAQFPVVDLSLKDFAIEAFRLIACNITPRPLRVRMTRTIFLRSSGS